MKAKTIAELTLGAYYELCQDVANPDGDKRQRYEPRSKPVWPAGALFKVAAEADYTGIPGVKPRVILRAVGRDAPTLYPHDAEALVVVLPALVPVRPADNLDAALDSAGMGGWGRGTVLAHLFKLGRVTIADFQAVADAMAKEDG